jgi:hypothetical protein
MATLERRVMLATFTPMTGPALQTAINNAALGDTITLDANTTYVGTFTLRNKTTGSGWITIQSSNLAQLPAAGVRVTPADAANMPNLQAPGSNAQAIKTEDGAHHYKLLGLEIIGPANNTDLTTLVEIGNDSQNTVVQVPHDIVIDQTYMRPNQPSSNIRRAVGLHGSYVDITNSYIEEIHEGSDSNAIAGWNGLGHYNIINNHLEGAGENILFGGATNRMPGTVADILIKGNHIIKPLHWRDGSKGYTPTVKNLFELKHGARVTLEDNILENCWTSGQTGVAIVLKLGDYNVSPQNVTEDVILRNNIIRHANGAVALQGRDYSSNSPDGLVRRITFSNNLFDDINGKWGDSGTGGGTFNIYLTQGPKDVTFDHNTFLNGYTTIELDSSLKTYPATNFVFKNNITAHNSYGVRSTDGTGNPSFANPAPGSYFGDAGHVFTKNILMGGNANVYTDRPGNYFPATWTAVGFVDKANGNFNLAASSIYNNVGTDGKDIGVDASLLPVEFAYMTGTTLNVRYDLITNAPRPITLDGNGSAITAMYDGEILPFTGVTNIVAIGTAGIDNLVLAGTSTLPLTFSNGAGNDVVDVVNAANWTLQSNIGGATRNVAVNVAAGGSVTFNATQRLRSLSVSGNATLSSGGHKVLLTKDLILAGKLDLTDNDLILDYSGADRLGGFNGTNYTGVLGLIQSAQNGGAWDGAAGLFTSMADAQTGLTTLGAAGSADVFSIGAGETALYEGETIDSTAVIVKYTYAGDANLDGFISGDDYSTIDFNVGTSAFGYANGDFNYDGIISGDDYSTIDFNFGAQGAPL